VPAGTVPGSGGNTQYEVMLLPFASLGCSCLDFASRGGYCKHMRAVHKKVGFHDTAVE
jgi:hypothetical protein